MSKVAGKGATVVEYLIQVFFKRLDAQAVDNKQVSCYLLETRKVLTTLIVFAMFVTGTED